MCRCQPCCGIGLFLEWHRRRLAPSDSDSLRHRATLTGWTPGFQGDLFTVISASRRTLEQRPGARGLARQPPPGPPIRHASHRLGAGSACRRRTSVAANPGFTCPSQYCDDDAGRRRGRLAISNAAPTGRAPASGLPIGA